MPGVPHPVWRRGVRMSRPRPRIPAAPLPRRRADGTPILSTRGCAIWRELEAPYEIARRRRGADGGAPLLLPFMTNCHGCRFHLPLCKPEQREPRVRIATRLAGASIEF